MIIGRNLYDPKEGVPGVRLAAKKDEGEIFALLLMLHAENGMYRLNKDKVIAGIQMATDRKGAIIYVIEADNRVVASLGMVIVADWYSNDEYLAERWNFVHPEYRKSNYARMLLEQGKWTYEFFKKGGRQMPFQCGINSFDRTEAKVRMYARHMPCVGAWFMFGEPTGERAAEQYRDELEKIDELNKKIRRERIDHKTVRPVIETILRVGRQASSPA